MPPCRPYRGRRTRWWGPQVPVHGGARALSRAGHTPALARYDTSLLVRTSMAIPQYSFVARHHTAHGYGYMPVCICAAVCVLSGATVLKQSLLHMLTLPSFGLTIYEYYAYLHLGHHAILGAQILPRCTAASCQSIGRWPVLYT